MDLAIANAKHEIPVVPGEEVSFRIEDKSWPKPWPEDTPMMLVSTAALLRVPVYADGNEIVVELNAADTILPQPSVGYCISAYHNGQMHRIASGVLRRQ